MPSEFDYTIPKFIRRVMPSASELELREATATFDRYMVLVWQIFQRIRRESVGADSENIENCSKIDDIQSRV